MPKPVAKAHPIRLQILAELVANKPHRDIRKNTLANLVSEFNVNIMAKRWAA